MVATEPFIGREVLRKEDPDLLTGQASYVDNQTMPGMLWMALVRPPYVHATVDAIDTAAAEVMPGVVGVYTAADLELGGLPFVWPITEDIKVPTHYPLTKDEELPTFAFPYSPAQSERGPLYEFALNHVMELNHPMQAFRLDVSEVGHA